MSDAYAQSSRHLRERLAPIVTRVTERCCGAPVALREPTAPMAVWFAVHDGDGTPLVLVSAHADSVSFLLGRRGFLHARDTAWLTPEGLQSWFEEVLDAALSGGLQVHADDRATLQTRSGPVALAL